LHARPDLVDRLKVLMTYTPDASMEFVCGIPVRQMGAFLRRQEQRITCIYTCRKPKIGASHVKITGRPWVRVDQ
jgi:hypothetical protein